MTRAGPATRRPFTIVFCGRCDVEPSLRVLAALRTSIRRCPHGMLVNAGCLRGPTACGAHPPGAGVLIVLQPCGADRRPDGPAHWLGPIDDTADIAIVQDWVESGEWERQTAPPTAVCGQRDA